ncbi:uncharacterized protein [Dendropsophus ebraccatus]|uniref:uncharacterized protein n=1 Tax=Dendropsophus ebraccatus TaxID=150705 RepID=UPI0038314039
MTTSRKRFDLQRGATESSSNSKSRIPLSTHYTSSLKFTRTQQNHREGLSFRGATASLKRDANGYIQTDVFRKKTAANSYLHASSSHPPSTINAIPVGQYLRIKRICSSSEDFEKQAKELKERFLNRGYSRRSLKWAYVRARNTPRHELLSPTRNRSSDNVIQSFAPIYLPIWQLPHEDPRTSEIFSLRANTKPNRQILLFNIWSIRLTARSIFCSTIFEYIIQYNTSPWTYLCIYSMLIGGCSCIHALYSSIT